MKKADFVMNSNDRSLHGACEIQLGEVEHRPVASRNGHSVDRPLLTSLFGFVLMLVSSEGLWDDHLSCEWRTGNPVLFCCPCSQVRDLTTFRTEGAPGVCIPSCGLVAQGAGHECNVTSELNEVQSLKYRLI